jgi:hypothetical protein
MMATGDGVEDAGGVWAASVVTASNETAATRRRALRFIGASRVGVIRNELTMAV